MLNAQDLNHAIFTVKPERSLCPSSAIKKNEVLPIAAKWMDLEGIMLSEISQRKTNTVRFHLYVESKKQNI